MTSDAVASGCRIALFRPFRDGPAGVARNVLLPVLEGYGAVDIVADPTFDRAPPQGVFRREYTEQAPPGPVHRFDDHAWQEGVRTIIGRADVAVLDLSAVSPNLVWEVAQCYRSLPPYRVILVLDSAAPRARSLQDHMRDFYNLLGKHPEMPRDVRPYVLIFTPGPSQEAALTIDIHRKMCEIVERETALR
jgi:hypothetical protein